MLREESKNERSETDQISRNMEQWKWQQENK